VRWRGRGDQALSVPDEKLTIIRKGNIDRQRGTPGAYVIGDPEFVRSVLEKDREKRLRIERYRLERLSINDVTAKYATLAGIKPEELLHRARGNYRAAARKVFADVRHYEYGFAIVEVARYFCGSHSPMRSDKER
jgi:hypothetical protein